MALSFSYVFHETLQIVSRRRLDIAVIGLVNILVYFALTTLTASSPIVGTIATFIVIPVMAVFCNALFLILIVQGETGISAPLPKVMQYVAGRFFPLIFTLILFQGMVFLGTLLLIIPGIIFSVGYSHASNFSIIEGDGPISALKKSWQLTQGKKRTLFNVTALVSLVISIPFVILVMIMNLKFKSAIYPQAFLNNVIVNIYLVESYVLWKTLKMR